MSRTDAHLPIAVAKQRARIVDPKWDHTTTPRGIYMGFNWDRRTQEWYATEYLIYFARYNNGRPRDRAARKREWKKEVRDDVLV